MVGVAVKVAPEPEQTGFAEAAIETEAITGAFTVMVTVPEVAGLPVGQAMFDVSTQATVLPVAGVKEYVELVAPVTLDPLTFH